MNTHEIPKHHRENIITYRGYMQPDSTYQRLPEPLEEVVRTSVVAKHISDKEANRLLHSQLVFLHDYTNALYNGGTSEQTPGWAIEFIRCTPKDLSKAVYKVEEGRRLFRALETAMRYSPTSALTLEILNALKVSYNQDIKIATIGGLAFYIQQNLVRGAQLEAKKIQYIRHQAIWQAYGKTFAHRYAKAHPDLTPGVYDAQGQKIKDGYVYLVKMLVLVAGLSKAAAARELGVTRLSVNNWISQ